MPCGLGLQSIAGPSKAVISGAGFQPLPQHCGPWAMTSGGPHGHHKAVCIQVVGAFLHGVPPTESGSWMRREQLVQISTVGELDHSRSAGVLLRMATSVSDGLLRGQCSN